MSKSLWPYEPQHARPPCPSSTPKANPNSCLLSQWCHPTVSSSVVPFSSCLQSLPASGSFQMYQLFAWGGQSIGSFSFNISPSNEFPGLISFRMDWLYLLAGSRTVLIIKLLKIEMKKMEGDSLPKKQLKEIFCTWKTEGFTTHPACWVETKPRDTSEKRFKTLVAKRRHCS